MTQEKDENPALFLSFQNGVWLLMGLQCPRPKDLSGEGQGTGFGIEGWPRVQVPFGCKELIWDLRMGGL